MRKHFPFSRNQSQFVNRKEYNWSEILTSVAIGVTAGHFIFVHDRIDSTKIVLNNKIEETRDKIHQLDMKMSKFEQYKR